MHARAMTRNRFRWVLPRALGAGILFVLMPGISVAQVPETRQPDEFHLEEATIEEIHYAIQDGQISCQRLVQAHVEPTMSDPTAQAQFGMVVGIPNAGQLNALSTLNLRGERSVTCKSACDVHPSSGALPADCPAVCDAFRPHPDALERAAELDAQYGDTPDLVGLPM